jgi:hypothetical protein
LGMSLAQGGGSHYSMYDKSLLQIGGLIKGLLQH